MERTATAVEAHYDMSVLRARHSELSSLRGPKIYIILTEGNIKHKHETDANESIIQ
jgi:hypothetical protein